MAETQSRKWENKLGKNEMLETVKEQVGESLNWRQLA
jgi:hypothetical protein